MENEKTKNIPLIRLQKVTKSYDHVKALDEIDFNIYGNEIVGLLGDNGAGKSTLIKVIAGVVKPERSEYFIDGKKVIINNSRDAMNFGIETIFQDSNLVDCMSIMRNIFLGREETNPIGKLNFKDMKKKTIDLLENRITIEGIKSPFQEVCELSGGQKQAVAVARAMYFKKRVLLLDEPTTALSVRETDAFLNHLSHLKRDGISIVFVTHNVYHAFQVADRFFILGHGKKLAEIDREEISLEELTQIIIGN